MVGIAALMVCGFVVLVIALTYDPRIKSIKSESSRGRASDPVRRLRTRQFLRRAQPALSAGRSPARDLAVTLRAWALVLAHEWWPRLRYYARYTRGRWLTLESRTGQVILTAALSVAMALLIVRFA